MERIHRKFQALAPVLDERSRRRWAATEAQELRRGGISCVARATGLARSTITIGLRELREAGATGQLPSRIRQAGGGRKHLVDTDLGLWAALDGLIEPLTRGDPESPLRWTCKSTRRLADELTRLHHPVSARTVASILHELGYSLQANRKTREGETHPDRNAQFEYISGQVRRLQKRGQPVVSVDTKKKELVGIRAGNGMSKDSRRKYAFTTSRTPRWARPFPTASTTWPTTRVGLAWAFIATPPSSPRERSSAGGKTWATSVSRVPARS